MIKKIFALFISVFMLSSLCSFSDASYVIKEEQPISNTEYGETTGDGDDASQQKYKVTFQNGSEIEKEIYVDEGYNVSLADIVSSISDEGVYDYTADIPDAQGNTYLSDYGNITSDVTFTRNRVVVTPSDNIDGKTTFSEADSGHLDDDGLPNFMTEEVELDSISYDGEIDSLVTSIEVQIPQSDYEFYDGSTSYSYVSYADPSYAGAINARITSVKDDGTYSYDCQRTNTYIGLTTDSSYDTAYTEDTRYDTAYKNAYYSIGSDNFSYNYCVYRFVLQNDVYLSGEMTIAGITGFGWGANDYSNMIGPQGTIVGPYCEIDLNGYSLIVGDGATLDCWGSITDSQFGTENAGSLILMPGSSFHTPFVIEDAYSESSYAVSYLNNAMFFISYRCPYVNAKTIIYSGANYYGKYSVDLGRTSNYAQGEILIIGSSEDAFIQFLDSSASPSYIVRNVSYLDWNCLDDTSRANLANQQISYDFYNSEIRLNRFEFDLSSFVSDITFDTIKCPLVIPSYFSFNLFNSSIKINQLLFFMPSSSVNIDKTSILIFGSSSHELNTNFYFYILMGLAQEYQSVGGMVFFNNFYPFSEMMKYRTRGWDLDAEEPNVNWFTNASCIWTLDDAYYDELNNHPAYANIYGSIEFDTSVKDSDEFGIQHDFMFGGQINFSETALNTFEQNVNQVNDDSEWNGFDRNLGHVYLNGEGFLMGDARTNFSRFVSNPWAFYTEPLISNGYVLTDPTDPFKFAESDTRYTYDRNTGIVHDSLEGANYVYFFDNQDNTNFYRASDIPTIAGSEIIVNGITVDDDLNGNYVSVTVDENNSVTYEGQDYIFYNGYFIPATVDDTTATGTIEKLLGQGSQYDADQEFSFTYSDGRWTMDE